MIVFYLWHVILVSMVVSSNVVIVSSIVVVFINVEVASSNVEMVDLAIFSIGVCSLAIHVVVSSTSNVVVLVVTVATLM
jgi:hypothetical protein